MKITLLLTGKTNVDFVREGMENYIKRIRHYLPFETFEIPELKNTKSLSEDQYRQQEGELQKKHLQKSDFIVLLDEKGAEYDSEKFARFIEHKMQTGIKNLVFVVGGAYGFSAEIRNLAHAQLSLSKMTFTHQMVRLIFVEQLYRAFTIIRGEKYHHS